MVIYYSYNKNSSPSVNNSRESDLSMQTVRKLWGFNRLCMHGFILNAEVHPQMKEVNSEEEGKE